MNIAFYSGASGLRAYQSDMDRLAHNIANVNTTGYKASRSSFSDLLYSRMAVNGDNDFLTGHGVKVSDADLIFNQGAVLSTNNQLDYGIIGSGFFAVQGPGGGEVLYTRTGNFDISVEGNNGYLVTYDGSYVLGRDGQKLQLNRNSDGTFNLDEMAGRLGVYQIPNPYGLEQLSDTRFRVTERSGAAQAPSAAANATEPYRIISSALESSSVELSNEMVAVMTTQKAFQFSARIVQTADQLEEIINNLR